MFNKLSSDKIKKGDFVVLTFLDGKRDIDRCVYIYPRVEVMKKDEMSVTFKLNDYDETRIQRLKSDEGKMWGVYKRIPVFRILAYNLRGIGAVIALGERLKRRLVEREADNEY